MNHCHMCSYKFAPYEVEFSDCGQITKFTFYFLPPKCVKSGRLTVGHVHTIGGSVADSHQAKRTTTTTFLRAV